MYIRACRPCSLRGSVSSRAASLQHLLPALLRDASLVYLRLATTHPPLVPQGCVLLASRSLETDVMTTAVRPMESCQRPEASLALHFVELRQLGA